MELSISIDNFEDTDEYREVNSPRTLEACLRVGVDPSELNAKKRGNFFSKGLTKDMVQLKYRSFERKRLEKIDDVKKERDAIIKFTARKSASQPNSPSKLQVEDKKEGGGGLVEQEEKRMEALKRRQEKELEKIMERESAMANLHEKIARAEAEEFKKKKQHEKAVAAAKVEAEKKAKQRAAAKKQEEADEAARKKELKRKEDQFTEKMNKLAALEQKRLEKEARQKDRERKEKMEEYKAKTAALIQAQADLAEKNRLHMLEREQRVQEQIAEKKERKRIEVAEARARAKERIDAALEKHHELHEQKKKDFDERQKKAEILAKQNAIQERIHNKEIIEAREKKNKVRYDRLVQAFYTRADHRQEIVNGMNAKEGGYEKIQERRAQEIAMQRFAADLKLQETHEHVERTARKNEFKRLQTLKRIEDMDIRYQSIQDRKKDLMLKYRAEQKNSLTRKHQIADAMELMKVTGDTKILDRIFAQGKSSDAGDKEKGDDGDEAEGKDAKA